jgi:hypothetical protein
MTSANETLRRVATLLESLAGDYYQTNLAIKASDDLLVQKHLDPIRAQRALLARLQLKLRQLSAPTLDEDLQRWLQIRQLTEIMKKLEPALQQWMTKPLALHPVTPNADWARRCVDSFLPLIWEYELDLVVLCGRGLSSVAKELTQRRQLRRIVYLSDKSPQEAALYPGELIVYSKDELRAVLRSYTANPPQRIAVAPLRQEDFCLEGGATGSLACQEVTKLSEEIFDTMQVERNTIAAFGATWVQQGLENLGKLASKASVHSLRDAFTNRPMVIIAPGPSLQKNAHLLRQLKGKALLVSFSHTLTALHKFGVVPDVVIALDSQDLGYHFEGYPVEQIEVLMLGLTVHPSLYQLPAKKIFTFAGNAVLDGWLFAPLGEDMRVPSGGSVAHSALSMGLQWGCNPILFVGQDLAFSDTGDMYAKESCDGDAKIELSGDQRSFQLSGFSDGYRRLSAIKGAHRTEAARLIEVPGYHGGVVRSSFSFLLFTRWFEEVARRVEGTVSLWNCTEGGARIEGMRQLTLAEAIQQLEGSPALHLRETLQSAEESLSYKSRRSILLQHVEKMLSALEISEQRANQCIRLLQPSNRSLKDTAALSNAEASLLKTLQDALFLSFVTQGPIQEAIQSSRTLTSTKECNLASRALYETVLRACFMLRPRVKLALQQLRRQSPQEPARASL